MRRQVETLLVLGGAVGIVVFVSAIVSAIKNSPVVMAGLQILAIATGGLIVAIAAGGVYLAVSWGRHRLERMKIETATMAGKSVSVHANQSGAFAVNPLGLPISALHLRTAPEILPGDEFMDPQRMLQWIAYHQRNQKVINQLIEPPMIEAGLQPVLPAIIDGQRLLVSGGMGTGKTNLLRWIAAEKQRQSKVLVIDTHAEPGQWPVDQRAVLGQGRNWAGVEDALKRLLAMMDSRFKDISAGRVGIRGHEIISVIADEWTMLPQIIGQDVIKEYTVPTLVESRKAGIDFILATHDTTVSALGIKGMGGLIKAFDWIVETDRENGQYVCKVRKPSQSRKEAVTYLAPPVFVAHAPPPMLTAPEPEWVTELKQQVVEVEPRPATARSDQPPPTDEENDILVAYFQNKDDNAGKVVWSQVCQELGLTPGTNQYNKLKEVIRRFTSENL